MKGGIIRALQQQAMAIWVLGLFTAILAVITAKQVNGIRHKIAEVENWAYQNFKECGIDPKRN